MLNSMVTYQESACMACYPPSRASTVQSDSLEACPWAQKQRGTEAEGALELHL